MTALEDLLAVQSLDTKLDQLRHRRATLPELARLAEAQAARADATARRDEIAVRLRAVRSAQKEAEDHAALLEDKAGEISTALYDGSVVSHKELETLQEELAAVQARQGIFEDEALEHMETAEPIEAELADVEVGLATLDAQVDQIEADLLIARTEIDVELERVEAERAAAVAAVPAEMVEAYEPRRSSLGGVAIARLVGARCEGCHLEIPSAQLEQLRHAPEDQVIHCPECLRILVR